eukprot:Platyproteum_vivax@DN9068_c0_g1_i1.p1
MITYVVLLCMVVACVACAAPLCPNAASERASKVDTDSAGALAEGVLVPPLQEAKENQKLQRPPKSPEKTVMPRRRTEIVDQSGVTRAVFGWSRELVNARWSTEGFHYKCGCKQVARATAWTSKQECEETWRRQDGKCD